MTTSESGYSSLSNVGVRRESGSDFFFRYFLIYTGGFILELSFSKSGGVHDRSHPVCGVLLPLA